MLIKCSDCGEEISDKLLVCLKCGCPTSLSIKDEEDRKQKIVEERQMRADEIKDSIEMPTKPAAPYPKNYKPRYIIALVFISIAICLFILIIM